MSWYAIAWSERAPVATVHERAIVTLFAHRANKDGTDCYPSIDSMKDYAKCSESTVHRALTALLSRKLIAEGDQRAAWRIPARYRPKVYDLLIPYDWYSSEQLAEVNRDRAERGLDPLHPDDRPPIAPPPPPKGRADKGRPAPNRGRTPGTATTSKNSQGCLEDTPDSDAATSFRDVSETPLRGVSETSTGGVSETPNTVRPETVRKKNSPSGRTPPSRTHTSDNPTTAGRTGEGCPTITGEALMKERRAKSAAAHLGELYGHQHDKIAAALDKLLEETGKPNLVRGYWLKKLKESKTWTYVIAGLTDYAADVHNARPIRGPGPATHHSGATASVDPSTPGDPNTTPDALLRSLGPKAFLPQRLRDAESA